jgi:hypothetical protein
MVPTNEAPATPPATNSYGFYKLKLLHITAVVEKFKSLLTIEKNAQVPDTDWIDYLDAQIDYLEDEMDAVDVLVDGMTGR